MSACPELQETATRGAMGGGAEVVAVVALHLAPVNTGSPFKLQKRRGPFIFRTASSCTSRHTAVTVVVAGVTLTNTMLVARSWVAIGFPRAGSRVENQANLELNL